MEKSWQYHRRKRLMNRSEVPLMKEVKAQLGEKLASVVFQECPEALKEGLGLTPPLKGPGDTLWVSPSDLLIGKVCLKPPFTDKYIKALTHQGIIDIGRDLDRRLIASLEEQLLQALREQANYLTCLAMRERHIYVKHAREEERAECEKRLNLLSNAFEIKLKAELEALEKYMLEIQEEMVENTKAAMAIEWQIKLDKAVEETTQRLTKAFLQDLEDAKTKLTENFRRELEKEQTEFDYAFKQQQEFCKETLKNLKHSLECKNFANLMYVLCMERRKCDIERTALECNFKVQIEGLNKIIDEERKTKMKIIEERDTKQKQIKAREECLLAIIKQFQKFINFALRATPTQAEYLLNVEKLMLFELTQAFIKSEPKRTKKLARTVLPWPSKSKSGSSSSSSSDLIAKDHHNCNNEVTAPDAAEREFMPAMFYDDHVYVREDFRNMFLNGIEMTQSNELWNRDVENLMKILKATVTVVDDESKSNVKKEEKITPTEAAKSLSKQGIHKESRVSYKSLFSTTSDKSKLHSLQKSGPTKSVLKVSEEFIKHPLVYCAIPEEAMKPGTPAEAAVKQIMKGLTDFELAPIDTTGILAAKDSLTAVRKAWQGSCSSNITNDTDLDLEEGGSHKPSLSGTVVSFEDLDVIRIPNEISLSKPSSRQPSKSSMKRATTGTPPIDSILLNRQNSSKSNESRLLSVKDSLVLHRQSICNTERPQDISKHMSKESRLSAVHVDSLVIIRKMTMQITDENAMARFALSKQPMSKQILIDDRDIQKRVSPLTVSRMEVANIPEPYTDAAVNFSPLHEVYETHEITLDTKDSPWKIYESDKIDKVTPPPPRDHFLSKANEAKIIGDPTSMECKQESEDFTTDRINSILAILREDPSLIKLFTPCT